MLAISKAPVIHTFGHTCTKGSGLFSGIKKSARFLNALRTEPQRQGERHTVLQIGNDFKRASYCGPGTKVIQRIKEGSKPINNVDKVCQAHDIRYSLAEKNQFYRQEKISQKRDQDIVCATGNSG